MTLAWTLILNPIFDLDLHSDHCPAPHDLSRQGLCFTLHISYSLWALLAMMLTLHATVQTLQMPVGEDVEELRRRLENALLRNMMQDRDATPLYQQNGYHVSAITVARNGSTSCRAQ